jgi:hypothetical protein
LRAYRGAQEQLRERPAAGQAATQLERAAAAAGLSRAETETLVDEWMQRRPLKYLRFWRASGLDDLLALLTRNNVRAGLLVRLSGESED